MRTAIAAVLLTISSTHTLAAENPVMLRVTVKTDGRVIDQPAFLAAVGQPARVSLSAGGAVAGSFDYIDPLNRRFTIEVGKR